MKVRCILIVLLFCSISYFANSQQLYAIKATSNWNDGSAWSTTSGGAACGCTPTAATDVYTDGKFVIVNAANASCKNLFVNYDIANSLTINSFLILTINGTLTGWDPSGPSPALPNAAVIKYNSGSSLKFTGASVETYEPHIVFAWSSNQPIGPVNFALTGVSKNLLLPLAFTGSVTISGGTLTADAGVTISGTSSLSIGSGATFITNDPVGPFTTTTVTGTLNLQDPAASLSSSNLTINSGGAVNSSGPLSISNNITISGSLNSSNTVTAANLTVNNSGRYTPSSTTSLTNTLTVNSGAEINSSGGITTVTSQIYGTLSSSSFFNTSGTLTLNAGCNLSTSYTGGPEGWWSGTSGPATTIADPASTVTFTANSAQNVYAQQYGNLTLTGAGAKTLTGSGALNVAGNLHIASAFNSDAASAILIAGNLVNSGSWTPTDEVMFSGTGSQQISGTVLPTFTGGLDVNKSGGTLSLLRAIRISNGLNISQGTLDASNYTITLSGALGNNGTLSFGSGGSLGTLVIDGTTSVSGTTPSFGHLTINSARSFSSTGTINVAGNITNNGSFNVGGVALNGTSRQNITGTLTLSNLTVRDGADVANLGTINMSTSGIVTLEGSGIFDAGSGGTNTLRLQSNSVSNGARIATLPNPDAFSGNVTVERFISAPEDWEYLAFPVSNPNVGMLRDDIAVTGNFTDASPVGGNVISSTSPSVYYLNSGWQAVGSGSSTAGTPLSGVTGYSVYSYVSSGLPIDVDGEINKGPKGVAVRSGDNLVPNPYPSAIDWDLVNKTGANLSTSTVYVRTASGQYASYNGSMSTGNHPLGSGWTGQLASGQAFWVLGAGAGTITFQEDDKVSSTNFVREAQPRDFLRIRLNRDTLSDDAIVHFKETATIGKDFEFDAPKKLNDLALNISTYNEDPAMQFAINGVPLIDCEFTTKIKLGTNNPQGSYSLAFEDLSSMTTGYEIVLIDNFLGTTQMVEEGTSYVFSVTSDPSSSGSARFELAFKSPSVEQTRDLAMESTVNCGDNAVSITIENSQPGIIYQFVRDGVTVSEPVVGNGAVVTSVIGSGALSSGTHPLTVLAQTEDGCSIFEYTNAINIDIEDVPVTSALSATSACTEGNVTLVAGGAPTNGSYNWYDSQDATMPLEGVNSAEFVTPTINKTTTYFVAAVNSAGCESAERVAMQAIVNHPVVPVITVQADILKVDEGLADYQWYLNGELIEGATSNNYQVKKSGTYTVNAISNGCSVTSGGFEYIVNGSEHKSLSDQYDVFPNPASMSFTLSGPDLDQSTIAVFDHSGKNVEIQSRLEMDVEGNWRYTADVSSLRNGVYLLNIQMATKVIQLKLVKR